MFTLDRSEYIEDIASTGYIYTHHSGCKLVFIENDDVNRVFSISFRTPAQNDKGTAHIVEHCVLCGSVNYNIKDPFNILDKGSMHTYLNAMTYRDKTVFPVAGTKEKDFKAMIRVYCDAVFNPLMYKNEGIFRQEGWNSTGSELNGVVLNEMKGVYSDSSVVLEEALNKKLYKDTPYCYDSGGHPDDIHNLSYEEFLEFHKKNYHPSNAVIYIYGKLDINEYLDILDNEFIGDFEYRDNEFVPPKFKPDYTDTILFEPTSDKNILQASYYTGNVDDFAKCIMLDILCDLFFNVEGAYIKSQLRDLGDQISASFNDSAYFTQLNVEISGSEQINLNEFKAKLNEAFKNAAIDYYKLQGVINSYKFYFKEEDFGYKPRGLFYNTLLLRAFMYGNYTFEPVRINKLFKDIKKIDIKKLINEYFVNKGCYGILINTEKPPKQDPVKDKNNDCVEKYQAQQDNPCEIDKINVSKVQDISKEPFLLDYNVIGNNIFVPVKGDVTYIDIMFDTSVVPKELLPALGVWQNIMDIYNVEYSNDIDFYLGGFSAGLRTLSLNDGYKSYMMVRIKTLNENIDKAIDIFKKITSQPINNVGRLEELLNEQKQIIMNRYISSGQIKGYVKALSALNEEYNYVDIVSGTGLYKYISSKPVEEICSDINKVLSILYNRKNISYSICGQGFIGDNILLSDFNSFDSEKYSYGLGEKESIAIKSNINFNCMGFMIDCDHGSYLALQQLFTREYIWDKIRLEGGAYGGGCRFRDGKACYLYSYRDPQLVKTYQAFNGIADYISKSIAQQDIDRFILGAINEADAPVKNSMLSSIAYRRHYMGIDEDKLRTRREQLLSTTANDIISVSENIRAAIVNNSVCTVGKKEDIEQNIEFLGNYFEI